MEYFAFLESYHVHQQLDEHIVKPPTESGDVYSHMSKVEHFTLLTCCNKSCCTVLCNYQIQCLWIIQHACGACAYSFSDSDYSENPDLREMLAPSPKREWYHHPTPRTAATLDRSQVTQEGTWVALGLNFFLKD